MDLIRFCSRYREELDPVASWDTMAGLRHLAGKLDGDERFKDGRWCAYTLATVYIETARRFEPVEEAFWLPGPRREAYLKSKKYYPWYGMGYAQLTHKTNYQKFAKFIGIPLDENPRLALEPEHSYEILARGLIDGLFRYDRPWPGRGLQWYFSGYREDPEGARSLVNGRDRAAEIAQIYRKFLEIWKSSKEIENVEIGSGN